MRRNKKGSMELSVNSIVILVIAIVIMGLILGFIRSKFAEVGGNLVTNEPDPQPASSQDVITLSRETVSTIPNGQAVLKTNVYNPTDTALTDHHMNITCPGISIGLGDTKVMVKSGTKTIPVGEQTSFIMTLGIGKNIGRTSYLCSAIVQTLGGAEVTSIPKRDFVLQVN